LRRCELPYQRNAKLTQWALYTNLSFPPRPCSLFLALDVGVGGSSLVAVLHKKMTFGFLTIRYCGAAQQCVASSFQGFLACMAQKFGHGGEKMYMLFLDKKLRFRRHLVEWY
jgi:hypothetical protein